MHIDPHGKVHKSMVGSTWFLALVVVSLMGFIVWDMYHPNVKEASVIQEAYKK